MVHVRRPHHVLQERRAELRGCRALLHIKEYHLQTFMYLSI